jgi:hypothetical protein
MIASSGAADCTCDGQRQSSYSADANPTLTWNFETYLVVAGGQFQQIVICYRMVIANKTDRQVLNLRWLAAGYKGGSVDPNLNVSKCTPLPGEMNPAPKQGRLYFGITSYGYDTTVREPKQGWDASSFSSPTLINSAAAQDATSSSPQNNRLPNTTTHPALRSEYAANPGGGQYTHIVFTSAVETVAPNTTALIYTFENTGNVFIRSLRVSTDSGSNNIAGPIEELPPQNTAQRKVPVPEGQGVDIKRGRIFFDKNIAFDVGLYVIAPRGTN